MKIRSQVFPTTNKFPIGGGLVHLSSGDIDDLFDDSYQGYLAPAGGSPIFNLVNSTGATYDDGLISFSSSGVEIWELNQSVDEMGPPLLSRIGAEFIPGDPIPAGESVEFFRVDIVDHNSGDYLAIVVNAYHNPVTSEVEAVTSYEGIVSGESIEGEPDHIVDTGLSVELHTMLSASGYAGSGGVYSDFTEMFGEGFQLSLEITFGGRDGDQIESNKFIDYPAIDSPVMEPDPVAGVALPLRRGRSELIYKVSGGYPGTFPIELTGTGSGRFISHVGEIEVIDTRLHKDGVKFMVSPMGSYEHDEDPLVSCRPQAVEGPDNQGSFRVPTECICDGTIQNSDQAEVEIVDAGRFGQNSSHRASKFHPRFLLKDDGSRYGESFDFTRIHNDQSLDLDPVELMGVDHVDLRQLRALQMENGDRLYYGTMAPVTHDLYDIRIRYSTYGEYAFSIEGEGEPEATEEGGDIVIKDVSRGETVVQEYTNIPSDFAQSHILNLEPGFYSIELRNCDVYLTDITESYNVSIANFEMRARHWPSSGIPSSVENGSGEIDYEQPYFDGEGGTEFKRMHANFDKYDTKNRSHKIFFEVKPRLSNVVAYYYSRCDNSIEKIVDERAAVSNRSDSISAVEYDSGKAAIMFKGMRETTSLDPAFSTVHSEAEGTVLDYITIDFDSMQVSDTIGQLKFTNWAGSYDDSIWRQAPSDIYAFDACQVGDSAEFFLSIDTRNDRIVSPNLGEGLLRIGADIPDFDEDEVEVSGSPSLMPGREPLDEIYSWSFWADMTDIEAWSEGPEDPFDTSPFTESFTGLDYSDFESDVLYSEAGGLGIGRVRVNYDKEFDEIVLSGLNFRSAAPIVLSGRGGDWDVRGIPIHFDFYSGGGINIGHDAMKYTNIDSLGASFGNDGMIYTIATKSGYPDVTDFPKRMCELGVLDSSMDELAAYKAEEGRFNSSNIVRRTDPHNQRGILAEDELNLWPLVYEHGRFRFRAIPVSNCYEDHGSLIAISDITKVDGYLLTTMSLSGTGIAGPIINQSCHPDEVPFKAPLDEMWTPEFGTSTYTGGATVEDWTVDIESETAGYFSRTFTGNEDYFYHGMGHRYQTVFACDKGGQDGMFNNNLEFVVVSRFDDNGTDRVAVLKMVFNGTQIDCRVITDSGHQSQGVICDIGDKDLVELNILVDKSESGRFNTTFVAKDLNHGLEGHGYDYNKDAKSVSGSGELIDQGTYDLGMTLGFDSTSPEAGDVVYIHQMGWGLLEPLSGFLSESIAADDDYPGPISAPMIPAESIPAADPVAPDGMINIAGEVWRDFSDRYLLNNKDYKAPFRLGLANVSNSLSPSYHWPNGILYRFTGSNAFGGDTYRIGRDLVTNISNIQPQMIHGNYSTLNDDTDVHIWMDAESAGLPYFEVDTFCLTGCNTPFVDIVARETDDDNWEVVDTIEFDTYFVPPYEIETLSTQVDKVVRIKHSLFEDGRFSEFDYYVYNGEATARVRDNRGDTIWLETNGNFDVSNGINIFPNRCGHVLNNPIEAKQVGIRLSPVDTYEGRFQIHNFGFGKVVDIPIHYRYDIGSGAEYEGETEVDFVFDEQPYSYKPSRLIKTFDLSYSVASQKLFDIFASTVRKLSVSRHPVWVLESSEAYKEKTYLCFFNGEMETDVLIDEDGEKWIEMSVSLRSSE